MEELERSRKDLEDNLRKKDQELKNLSSRVEDEQGQASNLQKKLKELQVTIESLI